MSDLIVTPAFNNLVDMTKVQLRFRKDSLGNTRPSVDVMVPRPSVEGIAAILSNGNSEEGKKQLDLLLDAVWRPKKAFCVVWLMI